jgi:stage II sporulation protein D
METPVIRVGILSAEKISFTVKGIFSDKGKTILLEGSWNASVKKNQICLAKGNEKWFVDYGTVFFPQIQNVGQFTLCDVVIGIDFHWERKENQSFKGALQFLAEKDQITAVNILSVEDYLMSVISSEMNATSSAELLKAHAVISRSWLLAQIEKSTSIQSKKKKYEAYFRNEEELMRWWDREDHSNYDVCADDHCQRYQGVTRASTLAVENAVEQTRGEVLAYQGHICDTRFSKCCGGVTELFEYAWEPVNHPYLRKVIDHAVTPDGYNLNLTTEDAAKQWILGNPPAFCNSSDRNILSQVLNDYDQETNDFYRWKVSYSQQELSELVKTRTEIDFGMIQELIPLERGASGRIVRLKIVGDKKELIIGKELQIRKALSKTHLYSSAFIVAKEIAGDQVRFELTGAGWGHGVGLCQIGAAVMADKGYTYREILLHYFRGAGLEKRY